MIYKLPKDRKALSALKDIMQRIAALQPDDKEWYKKFDDCKIDKDLYEKLVSEIQAGNIHSNTIQDQKYLEEKITRKENELLQMINVPFNIIPVDPATSTAQLLSGQAVVAIRPPKGNYQKPKVRK
jgi:hypothetical protein